MDDSKYPHPAKSHSRMRKQPSYYFLVALVVALCDSWPVHIPCPCHTLRCTCFSGSKSEVVAPQAQVQRRTWLVQRMAGSHICMRLE